MSNGEIVSNLIQAVNFLVSLLKKNWQNVRIPRHAYFWADASVFEVVNIMQSVWEA